MRDRIEEAHAKKLAVFNVFPGMKGEMLEGMAADLSALVLIAYAGGSINTVLIPSLGKIVQNNIPVFLLPDNLGSGHGTLRITDQPQVEALKVGATYLERANVDSISEVSAAIQNALAEGLTGAGLATAIKNQFAFNPGEKPISVLDDVEARTEAVRAMRERIFSTEEIATLSRPPKGQ